MGPAGTVIHFMRSHYLILLPLPPPPQGLLEAATLPFKHVLNCELLMLVPSHLQRLSVVDIDEVVNSFVVNLDEGNEDLVFPLIMVTRRKHPKQFTNGPRNDAFTFPIFSAFYSVSLSRTSLPVRKDG